MGSYHVGASLMGTVFAFASSTTDITTTPPEAVTTGIWFTFVVAVILIIAAQAIAVGSYRRTVRNGALALEAETRRVRGELRKT